MSLFWMFVAGWLARSLGARIYDRKGGLLADLAVLAAVVSALYFGLGGWPW